MDADRALTWLLVPSGRPDRFAQAAASGADAVILDLADARGSNADARRAVVDYLAAGHPAYVRIGGRDAETHAADVAALAAAGSALKGVMVRRSESRDVFAALDRSLADGVVAIALVETAAGLRAVDEIAGAPRVARLALGAAELLLECGIEDPFDGLLAARSTLVFASRAAGLPSPIDGATAAIDDAELARGDAQHARRLGFGAKLCLHAGQIRPVLEGFTPDALAVRWARTVLECASQADGYAVRVGHELLDAPLLHRAEHVLARHVRTRDATDRLT
jgi:citrate lyase beta subunit